MPRGNRTGPMGGGPLTGRRAGYCAGYDAPGFANPGPMGRGMRIGRGMGRGIGRGMGRGGGGMGWDNDPMTYNQPAPAALSSEDEAQCLKALIDDLESEMMVVRERLNALQKSE